MKRVNNYKICINLNLFFKSTPLDYKALNYIYNHY